MRESRRAGIFAWGIATFASLLIALPARAQGWSCLIEGTSSYDSDLAQASDGGFVHVASDGNLQIVKVDAAGSPQWQWRIGSGTTDPVARVARAAGGGLFVATQATIAGASSPWILKLDESGVVQWQEGIDGGPHSRLAGMAALADGGVVLVGSSPAWLLRLDATGSIVTYARVDLAPPGIKLLDVHAAADGGWLLAGVPDIINGGSDVWLGRMDATGALVRQKMVDVGRTVKIDLDATSDAGWIASLGHPSGGDWCGAPYSSVLRVDPNLDPAWHVDFYDGGGAPDLRAACQAADDGYLLAGSFGEDPTCGPDDYRGAYVLKLDSAGAIEWQWSFRRPGDFTAIEPLADGGAALGRWDGISRMDAAGAILAGCDDVVAPPTTTLVEVPDARDPGAVVVPLSASLVPTTETAVSTGLVISSLGDAFEPDDSCRQRPSMQEAEPEHHDFCDDPEDWFELVAGEGVDYTIETFGLAPLADTVIEVFTPDCSTMIVSDDDGGGGRASRIDWVAPADGRYPVRIRPADGVAGPDRGYDVLLTRRGPGCATWVRSYDPPGYDFVTTNVGFPWVSVLPDGTIAATMRLFLGINVYDWLLDSVVARLDPAGGILWQSRLGGDNGLWVAGIEATPTGTLLVHGVSTQRGGAFIFELDGSASVRTGAGYTVGFKRVLAMSDGTRVAVGDVNGGASGTDACILTLSRVGLVLAQARFGVAGDDSATDVIEAANGDVIVAGSTSAAGGAWISRRTSAGVELWSHVVELGATGSYRPTLAEAADGGVLLARAQSLLKLDSGGAPLWQRGLEELAGPAFRADGIAARPDGGCIVAGTHQLRPTMVAFDAFGRIAWQRTAIAPLGGDTFTSIDTMPDESLVLAGAAFVMRTDSDGRLRDGCVLGDDSLLARPELPSLRAGLPLVPSAPVGIGTPGLSPIPVAPGHEELCAGNAPRSWTETRCADGADDDLDGAVDCDDGDCATDASCAGEDFDGDGSPNGADCRPLDPLVFDAAPEVTGLRVTPIASSDDVRLAWDDVSTMSGIGTTWWIASDLLSVLHSAREARGTCLVRDVVGATFYVDSRSVTADGYWYLVRGETDCGPPAGEGWGRDSLGAERPGCP